ncbi:MAG: tetraacyldisaccharide 4'-kinase [Ignavibacteriaceae bacterium]
MRVLRIILLPLVPVYAAVIKVRNKFFDKNIFKAKKVDAKVISVGNITIGGSGKTPLVIYLANLLKKHGKSVGVLSRGYGRKSKGYLLVSDGKNIFTSVDLSGDEIFHTAMECNVPAAVSENRFDGANKLIKDTGINVMILDDAYQHRWIKRDINLLICEQRFLLETSLLNQSLLPSGNMREPLSSVKRADAVILNRKFSEKKDIPSKLSNHFEGKEIFSGFYSAIGFGDIKNHTKYELEEFHGQQSLIVSGVANPYSFLNILKQVHINTDYKLIFKDHKDYSLKEVQLIRKKFYSTNSHSVVTTEKDAVKLTKFSKELDDIDIFFLKIELKIDNEESFIDFILNKIN